MSLLSHIGRSWKCQCHKHSMPPVQIRISNGARREIPDIIRELKLGLKGVVLEDANTRDVAGAAVVNDLKRDGFSVSEVIVKKPDEENVARVESQLARGDFLVGVGGTSVLDIAKLAAHRKTASISALVSLPRRISRSQIELEKGKFTPKLAGLRQNARSKS